MAAHRMPAGDARPCLIRGLMPPFHRANSTPSSCRP